MFQSKIKTFLLKKNIKTTTNKKRKNKIARMKLIQILQDDIATDGDHTGKHYAAFEKKNNILHMLVDCSFYVSCLHTNIQLIKKK